MIDLIVYFGWEHVSSIYSKNMYGQPGIDEFHRLAQKERYVLMLRKVLMTVTQSLSINSSANIVVLYASGHHVVDFLPEIKNRNLTRKCMILGLMLEKLLTLVLYSMICAITDYKI